MSYLTILQDGRSERMSKGKQFTQTCISEKFDASKQNNIPVTVLNILHYSYGWSDQGEMFTFTTLDQGKGSHLSEYDGTQNFKRYRYRYFFRYQIFTIPIPVLFSGTKFFRYRFLDFFPVPSFSDTGSETFSGTIFFRYRFRYH